MATQLIYLQISKGQCCFLLVVNMVCESKVQLHGIDTIQVNMVPGSLGQPFSHENPSVNAALHGFHMQIHLSIIIIHLLPRWGHSCLNLTENCQSLLLIKYIAHSFIECHLLKSDLLNPDVENSMIKI